MRILPTLFSIVILLIISKVSPAETIKIEFTEDDSYSIEVAHIDVGDTIEWLPKNEGHNVEFLGGPNMSSLPESSEEDAFHSVTFDLPGLYLYHCKPHGNTGMLGLVIVGNDLHNLKEIKGIELSSTAKSILLELIKTIR